MYMRLRKYVHEVEGVCRSEKLSIYMSIYVYIYNMNCTELKPDDTSTTQSFGTQFSCIQGQHLLNHY